MLHLERYQYGIGRGLNLCKNHRAPRLYNDDYWFLAHLFLRVHNHHHIVAVVSLYGLAAETAVGCLLHRVASGYAYGTRILGSIVIILQTERHISVASLLHVVSTVADTSTGFLNQTDGKVGLLWFIHHIKVSLHQSQVDRLHSFLLRNASPQAWYGRKVTLGHIHLHTVLYRQHIVVVVLKHHNRFKLSFIALLHKLRIAHELLRFCRVQIRILKQSHAEHI